MSNEARLHGLEARLRALQDRDAIETLKARYWHAVDQKNPEAVSACLTANAVVDFEGLPRFESRDAFMEIVHQGAARTHAFDMHHGHNPQITFTGPDTARGLWDIFYYGIDVSTGTLVQMAGHYTDDYIRQGGTWLIASTIMRQSSLLVLQATPGATPRTLVLGSATAPISFAAQAPHT